MVVPIFSANDFDVIEGTPASYDHRSEGSGKFITIHFCQNCGTKLFLGFERSPGVFGVYGGTFDDPNWYERKPENTRHIFLNEAMDGVVVPPGFSTFAEHAIDKDGAANVARVFEKPHLVDRRTKGGIQPKVN
jgi:hypothetical protein